MKELIRERQLLYKIAKQKDQAAFGELYDRYVAKIYRFVFFKVSSKEEAEDITSEVFLKVWHYLTEQKSLTVKSLSGLVYKVARTCVVDWYRSRGSRAEITLEAVEHLSVVDKQFQMVADRHEAEKLLQVIGKLKREYQEVILLRYIEDLSIKEIAQILEKKTTNVRVTLFRALKVTKDLLKNKKD